LAIKSEQRNFPMPRSPWPIWFALALLLAGCGKGEPTLVPTEGRILYRGQPVDAGTVVFTPDPDRGNSGPIAWAEIQRNGSFRLKSDDRDGATLGWHRVTVAGASQRQTLPAHYRDPERSRLQREVKPGGTIELSLD
jgi:hypothetical protein